MESFKSIMKFLKEDAMSDAQIAVAVREMIAAEFDAIKLYTEMLEKIDNPKAKAVIASVIEEERVHVGEFQELLFELDPMEKDLYDQGAQETLEK